MANVLVQDSSLTAIADAIREKNGETTTYKPADMASAIAAITTGGGALETNTFVVNPDGTSSDFDLAPYIDEPDDLIALIWTGPKLDGRNHYLYVYFASPARDDKYKTRKTYYMDVNVEEVNSYTNPVTRYQINRFREETQYGLYITPALRARLDRTDANASSSEGFYNSDIIVVTRKKEA